MDKLCRGPAMGVCLTNLQEQPLASWQAQLEDWMNEIWGIGGSYSGTCGGFNQKPADFFNHKPTGLTNHLWGIDVGPGDFIGLVSGSFDWIRSGIFSIWLSLLVLQGCSLNWLSVLSRTNGWVESWNYSDTQNHASLQEMAGLSIEADATRKQISM